MNFLALYRDSCDGKSRSLGLFAGSHEAENAVRRDIDIYLKGLRDESARVTNAEPNLYEVVASECNVMCAWEVVAAG